MQRDKFMCQICGDEESMLTVHHKVYEKNREPWEYEDNYLVTVCDSCHKNQHSEESTYTPLLIKQIKVAGFFADDIRELATGFNMCSFSKYNHKEIMQAISFLIGNKELLESLVNKRKEFFEEWNRCVEEGQSNG